MTNLTITTSEELADIQKSEIEKAMTKKYGMIKANYRVDDALIGGIVIFDGDTVYDGSIRTQLNNLKEKISK